jgi:hypothetical protein
MADPRRATLAHLEILVANQRRAVRWYAMLASFWGFLGLSIVSAMWLWGERIAGEQLKIVLGIGGGLFTSGCMIPAKEVLGYRDRLDIFLSLRQSILVAPPTDVERIRTLVWAVLTKMAGA